MKISVQFLCMIFLLMFISCSTSVERNPAAEIESAIFTETFSFPVFETDSKVSLSASAKNELDLATAHKTAGRRVDFVQDKTLPKNIAHKVELIVDPKNGMMIFQVRSTPSAFKDTIATTAMVNFVNTLLGATEFNFNPQSVFEMYYNAKSGDLIALDNFLKIKARTAPNDLPNATKVVTAEDYQEYFKSTEELRKTVAADIKDLKKKRVTAEAKRKIILNSLDKAAEGKQFRALVAKNDRKGAMAILKKYLPWEDMAPFEKQFWENYISVTENPVPLEQRVLIYRGLDEDFIHRGAAGAKELTEKQAILSGNAFVMSSGLVKNQGSWNRRLRTLESMNQKFIGTINGDAEYAQSARISTMFRNHSAEPKGSPFISLTPNISVADQFGSERISSYLIDPRLLSFNYASSFDTEYEFLLPLTTFPDEMVGIADVELIAAEPALGQDRKAYLANKLKELITKKFGADKEAKISAQIKTNSYDFFKGKYPFENSPKTPGVPANNLKFYKKFLSDADPVQPMKPNGELTCKDLLELFWMAN